jgi:acyl carrier protein
MAWQNAMTQAHLAYLKVVESSFAAQASTTVSAVARPAVAVAPAATHAAPLQPVRAPAAAAVETKTRAPSAPTFAAPEVRTEKPDLKTALIEVVAEKTGYPASMLNLEMALEADLGIDSIKRVEILSALDARVPGLAKIDLSAMVSMRTLGAIVAAIDTVEAGAPKGPAAVVTPDRPASAVESFAVKVVRRAAPGVGIRGLLRASRLVITEDGAGVADALLSRLQQLQIEASKVATIPSDADAVIWLGGLAPDAGFENAMTITRDCFHAAQVLAPRFSTKGGVFVTVQDTGGDFGFSGHDRAWLGGIAGIAKTAAVEWPGAAVKVLDVETAGRTPDAIAEIILSELLHGGRNLEVGFSANNDRLVVRTEKQGPMRSPERAHGSSFVLATGGGRGITAACLEALAKKEHGRFLLLGRTMLDAEPAFCHAVADEAGLKKAFLEQAQRAGQAPIPAQLGAQVRHLLAAREIKRTLESIERAGGQARYASVDVRNVGALRNAIDTAKAEWGPVTDLVHGAGVIEDRPIAAKTDGQFDEVLATKVYGLRALLEATAGEPLGRILLFSSAAARSGNPGQCDYAAANEVLNKVAALEQRRRGATCVVKAFGWGPWAGGMVSPALQRHFEERGTPVIPMADGCRIFVDAAVRSNEGGVETVIGSLDVQKPPAVPGESTFETLVHPAIQPFLSDHAIDTVVVLPVALVVEWFTAAARALHPDLHVKRIRDLRVLKGARLPDFANSGRVFSVHCKRIQNGAEHNYAMTTLGLDGVVHHSAVVELSETMLPAQASKLDSPAAGPFTGHVYGHALFHGPSFQMIRDVSAVSMTGARARLVGTRALDWKGSWSTDAAAFDGALQLALLWSAKMHGGRSLPTSIAEIRFGAAGPADQPLTCVLGNGETRGFSSVCDLSLRDSNGTVVFELGGVELFRRPEAPGVVEMRT